MSQEDMAEAVGLAQRYLDMLSGEQAELPPVEMLVSMLSELSRLSVS